MRLITRGRIDDHVGVTDHREHLRRVRRRPDMFLAGGAPLSFDKLVTYVEGIDVGSNRTMLDGFYEYCVLRLGRPDSRSWRSLVASLGLGAAYSADQATKPLTAPQDSRLVAFLFEVLDEFLAETDRHAIHREYLLWQQQQAFYDLDLLRFSSSPPPPMLTVEAAAALLATDRQGVFDLVAQGKLTIHRAGSEVLFRPFNIERYLANRDSGAAGR
jgi:excisionase family DNA binding protein